VSEDISHLKAALSDRYEIEREVGAGGMATVYLARDVRHQRRVALKVLRPDLAATLGPDRFLQEVRVTANLQHPHILPLFDSGETDGFLWYVMPFVEGESLRDRLAREGELPVPDAVRLLRDVVDALAAAHRLGVVHRDIKPENILLSGRHALVADFGVAKAVTEATGRHQLTTMGVALGTPTYMAPEQAAAEPTIDHRADLYAVGAMGYELLTGRPPITGSSPREVLTAQVTRIPEPVTQHRPAVPPALETLLMRCLEKRPADRWQSAAELLAQLEAVLTPSGGMTPTGMQPVTAGSAPVTPGPRRWLGPAGALAVAVAAAVWALRPDTPGSAGAGDAAAGETAPTIRVMILPLANRTGDPAVEILGTLVAETATRHLQRVAPDLEVMPPGAVAPIVAELGGAATATAAEAGRRGDAAYVVSGAYARLGESLRFDVEITDVATGALVVAPEPVVAAANDVNAAVAQAAEVLAAAAAFRLESGPISGATGYSPPRSLSTLETLGSHSLAFCRQDYDESLRLAEEMIRLEPTFVVPYHYGMASYGNGGRSTLTGAQIRELLRAQEGRMTATERAGLRWLEGAPDEAFEAARTLFATDSTFYAYHLLWAGVRTNQVADAVRGADGMDASLGGCYAGWRPAWSLPMTVYHLAGDGVAERELAREGRDRFPQQAVFPFGEARSRILLGDPDGAEAMAAEIEAVPTTSADVTWHLLYLGEELQAHGHPEAARRVYARAWAWVGSRTDVEIGPRSAAAYRALPPEEALPHLEAARDALPTSTDALGRLAVTLQRVGRVAEAESLAARIREILPTSFWPAYVAASRGDAPATVAALRRRFAAGGTFGDNIHRAPELLPVAGDAAFQTLMRPKTGG